MKKTVKTLAICTTLCTGAIGGVCKANDCKEMKTESTIAALVQENEGSKVLKVEEAIDEKGCVILEVRILIDGTVKAITIPNEAGA